MKAILHPQSRRTFLRQSIVAASGLAASQLVSPAGAQSKNTPRFEISLHQYSLKPLFDAGQLDVFEYPRFVKEKLGLANIEFAAEFCGPLLDDLDKADALRRTSEAAAVRNRVFLCSADTALDAADENARQQAVEDHLRWAQVAQRLGCESIRVRAGTEGDLQDQLKHASAGIGALCEALESSPVSVLIENITGPSRDPEWLVQLVERIGRKRVALLADFGNFDGDFYAGMKQLLPLTKSICSKSWDFDAQGNETKIDYARMMKIIKESDFRGCISIEYLGTTLPPVAGIQATAKLIERLSSA